MSLHHVQVTIPVGAEPEARWFYCDLLGLAEIDKPPSLRTRGGLWLQLGDRELHLGVEDGVDRHRTKAHVAYEVDDVDQWRNKLAQHGFRMLDSAPIEGFARFEARDPFGNRIEFIQKL